VDDPFDFGRVAAANALSDVYAMGARPLFALNIVAFPLKALGAEALGRMLAGGAAATEEAGIPILGGHSIDDTEPKYGLAVTGVVHPERLLRNTGGVPGDVLFLTKPLGSGVLTGGIKSGRTSQEQTDRVIEVMTTLNRSAAEAIMEVGVHAATDVTGFGLLGHLRGMVRNTGRGPGTGAELDVAAIPVMDGVRELLAAGVCPGGTRRNLAHFGQWTTFDAAVSEVDRLVCADAQTSGGLLVACPADRADDLTDAFAARSVPGVRIGRITASDGAIAVRA
jgi:selenide,water dikinase